MRPYLQDVDFTLFNGDAREVLAELPDESVHMCVTSPPFFGLRDYGVDGQIGLEPTPADWVAELVKVFEQVRRVLRKDGTLWVECGDSYNSGTAAKRKASDVNHGAWQLGSDAGHERLNVPGMKTKDLIGQPFLLAFALREAGWYWRNVLIWHKPNPMPESVRDRFTVSHSYVLLFSKSPRYYFDAEAVREAWESGRDDMRSKGLRTGTAYVEQGPGAFQNHDGKRPLDGLYECTRCGIFKTKTAESAAEGCGVCGEGVLVLVSGEAERGPDGRRKTRHDHAVETSHDNHKGMGERERWPNSGRNARSVWTIATEPLPFEHYAAFPQALVERCIKAGTSERGCCPECGAPWIRQVVETYDAEGRTTNGPRSTERRHESPGRDVRMVKDVQTTGWHPRCECGVRMRDAEAGRRPVAVADGVISPGSTAAVPCIVLDPFLGSGTTALVARRLGRRCIGVELSERYCELTAQRTQQLSLEAAGETR